MRAPGSRRRRAVSVLTVAAGLVVLGVAAGAVVFYPSITGGLPGYGASTSTSYTTDVTSYTTTSYSQGSTSSNETSAPPQTNSSTGGWQAWQVANVTLGSPQVQTYVHDAYSYNFSIFQTGTSPVLVSNLIHVTGALAISGNWSTGYNGTYLHNRVLNVTIQYTPPSSYQIIGFAVQNMSDRSFAINFTSVERQAISSAVENGTVKTYLTHYPSYAESVFLLPTGNGTFGGDYLVLFYPVSGTNILGVFVNPTQWTVVSTYNDTRVSQVCYGAGACWTSPWGAGA